MPTWIALLRGINVGGKNKLPMKELVADLESLKLKSVRTYIQSGNVVFQSSRKAAARLASDIAGQIEDRHGFRPQVVLRTHDQLREATQANPYPEGEAEPKTMHLFFLGAEAKSPDLVKMDSIKLGNERYALTSDTFYLHAPDGIGKSKLAANAEKFLGVTATARNWRTVVALDEMAMSTAAA